MPAAGNSHVMASGDPQLSLGMNGITGQVILPGDRLLVACEFNSLSMDANSSAVNDTCAMDLMVYSALPHTEVCTADASTLFYESSPGNMKRSSTLLPDPYPLWRPLQYTSILSNQVRLGAAAAAAAAAWVPGVKRSSCRRKPLAALAVQKAAADGCWKAGYSWVHRD
jgi:hypothetical protein